MPLVKAAVRPCLQVLLGQLQLLLPCLLLAAGAAATAAASQSARAEALRRCSTQRPLPP